MENNNSNIDRSSPEDHAGIISRLFFCWMQPLISQGRRQPLQMSDLYPLSEGAACGPLADLFEQKYYALKTRNSGWLLRGWKWLAILMAIGKMLGWKYWRLALFKPVWFMCAVGQVYALRVTVERVTRADDGDGGGASMWAYLLVAFGMFVAALTQGICYHALFHYGLRAGLKAETSLAAIVYRKALRLSLPSTEKVTQGQVGNLIVSDVRRLSELLMFWHYAWFALVELVVLSLLLYIDLGPSALFGIIILFLLLPLQFLLSLFTVHARKRAVLCADDRIQVMGEVLQGVHAVKLNAWEPHFHKVIADKRRCEIHHLRAGNLISAVSLSLFDAASMFVASATFLAHTLLFGNTLTPKIAFSSLGLFNVLKLSLSRISYFARDMSEAVVSLKRIHGFLSLSELPQPATDDLISETEDREDSPFHARGGSESVYKTEPYSLRALIVEGDFAWYEGGQCQQGVGETTSPSNPVGIRNLKDGCRGVKKVMHGARNSGKLLTSPLPASDMMPASSIDDGLDDTGVILRRINFAARDSDLICIVGAVGSGKTSLLLAILGELHLVRGSVRTFGSVAYCAQQPWIVNGTLRENITLFRKKDESMDEVFYNHIIDACCFRDDLQTLPAGDLTEIGERGVNLSGGQKARLALCRALYSDAELYLLDDPLSAVDAIVGKQIKEQVLGRRGILSNKCRVVVTHQLQLLPESSRIIVLARGKCVASGTYYELIQSGLNLLSLGVVKDDRMGVHNFQNESEGSGSNFSMDGGGISYDSAQEEIKKSRHSVEESNAPGKSVTSLKNIAQMNKSEHTKDSETMNARVVTKEDRRIGRVAWPVYRKYARAAGGVWALLLVISSFTVSQAVRQLVDWWLAGWSTDSRRLIEGYGIGMGNRFYGLVFTALVLGACVLFLLRGCVCYSRAAAASRHLHNRLLERILHATLIFFESNPVGRILNRFSRDVDQMDNPLPITAENFLNVAFATLGSLIMISWILPWFLLALVPLTAGFWFVQHMYVLSSRELKRLEGISKSPVYAQYTETMSGLTTVRAFCAQEQFRALFEKRVDTNQQAFALFWSANRWVGTRLDFLAACVVFVTSVITVSISEKVSPGLAGVALSQSLLLTGLFQWGVRQKTECENLFTSVERITAMTAEAPVEAPSIIPENRPDASWPSEGIVEYDQVELRYRPHLEPALKGVSFRSKAFERIGVCGRTGAGKSSIFVALFRMVELNKGRILIDGMDISKIGLRDLRLRLAIVPQDPVLFNSTIRQNIDPLGRHTDAELWEALERVHMRQAVISGGGKSRSGSGSGDGGGVGVRGNGGPLLTTEAELGAGLDLMVSQGGSNFSSGERQLLSLARAILSGARVVVLDEATASVDRKTDALIQQAVRSHLHNCTVITVAHRLDTIVDSDRILVIENGTVVEMDTPERLMKKKNGYFARLVEETEHVEKRELKHKIGQCFHIRSNQEKWSGQVAE